MIPVTGTAPTNIHGSLTDRLALTVLAVYALVSLGQVYAGIYAGADLGLPWWAPAVMVLPRIAYLTGLTPFVLYLARRFRIQPTRRIAHSMLHILALTLIVPGYAGAILLSRWLVTGSVDASFWNVVINRLDENCAEWPGRHDCQYRQRADHYAWPVQHTSRGAHCGMYGGRTPTIRLLDW